MGKRVRDVAKERWWREALAQQRASGLNVRAFCRQQGLAESALHSWRRTIAERDGQVAARRGQAAQRGQSRATVAPPSMKRQPASAAGRAPELAFVPAVVTSAARGDGAIQGAGVLACAGAITIELAGGCVLRLPGAMAAARIAELVQALETRGAR